MKLSTTDGLPGNLVYCAYQDHRKMLWFGTDKGLIKYDNKAIRIFTTENGLPDPEIVNIFEDYDERLWINSFRKKLSYVKYDTIYSNKSKYFLNDIDLVYGLSSFYKSDNNGTVWVTNTTDLVYNIIDTNVYKYVMPNSTIQIHEFNDHLFAFGSGHIFNCKNPSKPTIVFDIVKELGGIPKYVDVCFYLNRILYSFNECMLLIEYNDNKFKVIDKIKKYIGRLYVDKSGRFWVCTSRGAICFDNNNRDLTNPKVYLPGKKTTSMIEDAQGTFWFCTLEDGVFGLPKYPALTYSKTNGLSSDNLFSVAIDSTRRIYFGDDEGNMYIINKNGLSKTSFGSVDGYNRVLGIHPISDKEIWVVTDEGVYRQFSNGKRNKIQSSLGSPKVILVDNDFVWCGTSAGLFKYSVKTGKINKYTGNRITSIAKDAEDVIWAGGIEGIYSSIDSFQNNWGNRFSVLENRIVTICAGEKNIIWVVTPDIGLLKVRVSHGNVVQVNSANQYLTNPIHNVHSIYKESADQLWLTTNNGIYCVNVKNWHYLRYNQNDGLPNNDIRSMSGYNDTIWTASPGGLTRLLSARLREQTVFPTYITSIRYRDNNDAREVFLNEAPSTNHTITLPLSATLVEVDFAGLDYRSRGNLLYECIITKEQPPLQWITTDYMIKKVWDRIVEKPDTVHLTKPVLDFGVNMQPGQYKISVVAYTQNNNYGTRSDEWRIIMPPPWYSTIWFTMTAWALIGLGLIGAFRLRDQLRIMALSVARFKLLALQAQINPHFIGNAINATQRFFFPPEPETASLYIATFTEMLRNTLGYSETTFITFEEEVNYCQQYLDMTTIRYGEENFKYELSGANNIPPSMPFPSLFLQPIFENSTIHGIAPSGVTIVFISYFIRNGKMHCIITDNGPGINASIKENLSNPDYRRRSKGFSMLRKKALVLNHLFELDLKMEVKDLSDIVLQGRGTQVTVTFDVEKILKAPKIQTKISKYSAPFGNK